MGSQNRFDPDKAVCFLLVEDKQEKHPPRTHPGTSTAFGACSFMCLFHDPSWVTCTAHFNPHLNAGKNAEKVQKQVPGLRSHFLHLFKAASLQASPVWRTVAQTQLGHKLLGATESRVPIPITQGNLDRGIWRPRLPSKLRRAWGSRWPCGLFCKGRPQRKILQLVPPKVVIVSMEPTNQLQLLKGQSSDPCPSAQDQWVQP